MSIPRVYADFNAAEPLGNDPPQADMALTGYGTLRSLAQQRLRLVNGMALILYDPGDIECAGAVYFDRSRQNPAGGMGEWVARINLEDIRDSAQSELLLPEHPCLACGTDFSLFFQKVGQNYTEKCPVCGESVMAPLAPPDEAI